MSSRLPKVDGLREDLPPTISPATHPHAARKTICGHIGRHRNLVINLDGTANQFCEHSTNVVELFSRLIKDEEQLVYYDSGIGTYATPSFRSLSYIKQVIVHTIDTAIAWNFEKIVHAAYKWLSENYQKGDRIFLFGFSRGAYQARVIAGMIETVGLLHKGNERQIPFAYELYSSVMDTNKRKVPADVEPNSRTSEAVTEEGVSRSVAKRRKQAKLCRQFKQALCHKDVKVHFVGAWDTVSSIGVLRGKSLPETVTGMGHVCHFRHALALDERRVKFQPEFANGGLGPRDTDTGDVKEVWFSGSHSDIGGGNISNEELKNFGPALRWMTYEAMAHGLRIERYEGSWQPLPLTKSLTTIWRIFEIFPFPSLTYQDANSTSSRPHLCAGRKIQSGQLIHQSVFTRPPPTNPDPEPKMDGALTGILSRAFKRRVPSYVPKAALSDLTSHCWADLLSNDFDINNHPFVEKDPFENASHTLRELEDVCGVVDTATSKHRLQTTITTLQSYDDALVWDGSSQPPTLLMKVPHGGQRLRVSGDGSNIVISFGSRVEVSPVIDPPTALPSAIEGADQDPIPVIDSPTALPSAIQGVDQDPTPADAIGPLCFSKDNQILASGHANGWIQLWKCQNAQWKVFKEFKGRADDQNIWDLAFSSDGSKLAFDASPVKVWDFANNPDALMEMENSANSICLAWSPSEDWLVSGADDGWARKCRKTGRKGGTAYQP
ncbi:hypothetical protein ONZ45_g15908 [Pleurotus djamor]|nr:hypothetical protein ONZ45_g15908 [Pleurotus djamor]